MVQAVGRPWLIVAHTVVVLAAAIAAVFQIRIIMLSGPIVAATGLLVTVSSRRRRRIGFYFGLSSAVAVVVWFLIISGLSWGPDKARLPVSSFMIVFSLASIPVGVFGVLEIRNVRVGVPGEFQFSIGTLLSIMFFLALYLGLLRGLGVFDHLWLLWSGLVE